MSPTRPRQDSQAYRPCIMCGMPTLLAELVNGTTIHLDVATPCYAVAWPERAAVARAVESTAYVVHTCDQASAGARTARRGRTSRTRKRGVSLGPGGETPEISPADLAFWAEFAQMAQEPPASPDELAGWEKWAQYVREQEQREAPRSAEARMWEACLESGRRLCREEETP